MGNEGDRPHRPLCRGNTGKRPCYARDDSEWCANHDPDEAERRAAAGRQRRVRFTAQVFDQTGEPTTFERSKVPTIAYVVDRLLDVDRELHDVINRAARAVAIEEDAAERVRLLKAKRSMLTSVAAAQRARVAALKAAREALFDERAFAVERAQGAAAVGAPMPSAGDDADDELRSDA